jgi:TyrR family helix-turn-helix protein
MERYFGEIVLSKAELLRTLDAIDDAVFIDDDAGNALWINTACETLFEIEREKIVGVNVDQLEEAGIFTPSVAKMVRETGKHADIVHQNKFGKRILSTGVPVFGASGEVRFIITTSRDITELAELQNKLKTMQDALKELEADNKPFGPGIVAVSPSMRDVMQIAKRLSEIDSTVLISGESGVGKGVIAELLHKNGARKDKPFIKLNCGAIPANLIEAELFGYEGGTFTGGLREGKHGLFEAADGGSVFLDEISELPLALQVKLLQVIQDREIVRVGGVRPVAIDVRIISASNKDLFTETQARRFREDLYYRLNVVPIHVPPLRERREDIAPLVALFLDKYNAQMKEEKKMSADALALLSEYVWPGNVRELQNIIERLMITTKNSLIQPEDVPGFMRGKNMRAPGLSATLKAGSREETLFANGAGSLKEAVEACEISVLRNAKAHYGSTRAMAAALGVTQPTIVRKLQKYGL